MTYQVQREHPDDGAWRIVETAQSEEDALDRCRRHASMAPGAYRVVYYEPKVLLELTSTLIVK